MGFESRRHFLFAFRAFALVFALSLSARATHQGDFVQTDSLGTNLFTRDLEEHRTTTIGDAFNLSEYMGIHYYVVDRVRLGMTFQWTQRITPEPPEGESRFQRLAFLPQIGWNFCDPFYVAVIYGVAPYTRGRSRLEMTIEGAFGMSLPLSERLRFSLAAVVPRAFYAGETIGLTAISGLSFRLN